MAATATAAPRRLFDDDGGERSQSHRLTPQSSTCVNVNASVNASVNNHVNTINDACVADNDLCDDTDDPPPPLRAVAATAYTATTPRGSYSGDSGNGGYNAYNAPVSPLTPRHSNDDDDDDCRPNILLRRKRIVPDLLPLPSEQLPTVTSATMAMAATRCSANDNEVNGQTKQHPSPTKQPRRTRKHKRIHPDAHPVDYDHGSAQEVCHGSGSGSGIMVSFVEQTACLCDCIHPQKNTCTASAAGREDGTMVRRLWGTPATLKVSRGPCFHRPLSNDDEARQIFRQHRRRKHQRRSGRHNPAEDHF